MLNMLMEALAQLTHHIKHFIHIGAVADGRHIDLTTRITDILTDLPIHCHFPLFCREPSELLYFPDFRDGHAGSAIKVLVAIHYSVLDARNGYIRNVVV